METDCREGSVAVVIEKLPELEHLISLLQGM